MSEPSERKDRQDYIACMDMYGPPLTRCVGGRLVVDGYICPHCNSSSPDEECTQPYKPRGQE